MHQSQASFCHFGQRNSSFFMLPSARFDTRASRKTSKHSSCPSRTDMILPLKRAASLLLFSSSAVAYLLEQHTFEPPFTHVEPSGTR